MNGRAYDYNLGRFLSVDPFIQAPSNSQSMNPYSYIMNNPLAGTDPSGYVACDDAGQNCDLGNMSMDEVDNITVNDDGSVHVNTTDGNTYQVDSVSSTSNGVQISVNFNQGSGWSGKIEQIGSPSEVSNRPDIDDHSNDLASNDLGLSHEGEKFKPGMYGLSEESQDSKSGSTRNKMGEAAKKRDEFITAVGEAYKEEYGFSVDDAKIALRADFSTNKSFSPEVKFIESLETMNQKQLDVALRAAIEPYPI